MNSDSNSDSKQCTELKLSRAHSVHTLNLGCARTAPRPRARRTLGAVLQHAGRSVAACLLPCRCPLATIQNFESRHTVARTRARAPLAPVCRPAVSQRCCSVSCTRCSAVSRACALAYRDTIHCIATQDWEISSSPPNCLLHVFFFFTHFFFHLFYSLQDHKIFFCFFFFFHIFSRTKNIYYNFFFLFYTL